MANKWLFGVCLFLWSSVLAFSLPDGSDVNTSQSDLLTDSIDNLLTVEIELQNLNAQVERLKSLLTASQGDSTQLRELLTKYQARVEQLSKRYAELLKICGNLKNSLTVTSWAIPAAFALGIASVLIVQGFNR